MLQKHLLLWVLLLCGTFGFSQIDIKEGFAYLEHGNFAKAETFFATYLKQQPNHKTARLCYARAIGLHNNPERAKTLFLELLKEYPDDFEIQLNYAESLLWNKTFAPAKAYYQKLIQKDSSSFAAMLGYANSLSNLKQYQKALQYVKKALQLQPNNPNALLSQKYMRLGHAYSFTQKKQYKKALDILQKNFKTFKDDTQTTLDIAMVYLRADSLKKAKNTYLKLNKNNTDSIQQFLGLATVAHQKFKNKKALKTTKKAVDLAKNLDKKHPLHLKTQKAYINALFWNKKFKSATQQIKILELENPKNKEIHGLKASLAMYQSNFKKATTHYDKIREKDSTHFGATLGSIHAYWAGKKYKKAYQSIQQAKESLKEKEAVLRLEKRFLLQFSPKIEQKLTHCWDNGNNTANSSNTHILLPINTKFSVNATMSYRKTQNTVTRVKASTYNAGIGGSYRIHPKIALMASIANNRVKNQQDTSNNTLFNTELQLQPLALQHITIGYKKDIQDFNADLLRQKISNTHFYVNYTLNTNYNIGAYLQYFNTQQSDNNTRDLFFGSLYYTINKKINAKIGANYQYISFAMQKTIAYFSPSSFNAAELFISITNPKKPLGVKKWFYQAILAKGIQRIEKQKNQDTYRIQGHVGYGFSNRLNLQVFGLKSTSSSASAAGFAYNEIGIKLQWHFLKKPIFIKKEPLK